MNLFRKGLIPRRVKFIDPKQQSRFAFEIVVIMLLFPVLFFVLVTIPPFSTIFLGKNAEVLSLLFVNQLRLFQEVWWVVAFVVGYIILLSVLLSHKIFGPIYRMKQAIQSKMNGEEKIYCKLRKGDYFVDFAEQLSKLLEQDQSSNANPPKDPQTE